MASRTWKISVLAAALVGAAGQDCFAKKAEGPRVVEVAFEGDQAIAAGDLLGVLPFKRKDVFREEQLEPARRMVLGYYQTRGYLEAEVTVATAAASVPSDPDRRTGAAAGADGKRPLAEAGVAVTFRVREGPVYHFGGIELDGFEKVSATAAARSVSVRSGRPYDRRELFRTQAALYGLGVFEDVEIRVSTTPARTADVRVRVREQPLKWLRGGVGYGSEEKERFSLILTHNNFLRRLYTLELTGTLSRIWRDYKAEFLNRALWGSRTEFRMGTGWRHEDREGYDVETTAGQAGVGREIFWKIFVSPRVRFERNLTFDLAPAIAAVTPGESRTHAVDLPFQRDSADDPFFPTFGSRANLVFERAGGRLGGDMHFTKVSLDHAVYTPLFRSVVLALTARAGAVKPFGELREIPVFERFFAGGANSVRGYGERGLGPKDAFGNPVGGDVMAGAGAEVRFPLVWKLNGAAFFDGGQVAPRTDLQDVWRWKYGAGLGVRLRTPVGPIRLDYGRKVNRDPGDIGRDRWHFSLGQAF